MLVKQYFYFLLLSTFLVINLNACKSNDEVNLPIETTMQLGDLEISELKEVATKTIGTEGGELEVKDAQSSINGFKISVPAGTYASASALSVSVANVAKHSFGEEYKVLSPLISISEVAGGYTNDFIIMDIPIDLPENHFAVAMQMDDQGVVDILPLISISKSKLKVGISSFSKTGSTKNGRMTDGKEDFMFLVTSVDRTGLMDFSGPNTDVFTPGVDDWAFTNRGSVLASGGYCSGSTLSALWYFNNRKKVTNIPLHELGGASNAPSGLKPKIVEESNSLGIKYVSLVQELAAGFNERTRLYKEHVYKGTSKIERDECLFYYAGFYLRKMGKPLLLGLRSSSNPNRGHLIMIVGKNNKDLKLANPNAPRATQQLTFDTSVGLKNFKSAEIADETFDYDVLFALPPEIFDKDVSIQSIWEESFDSRKAETSSFFPSFSYYTKNADGDGAKTSLKSGTVNKITSPFLIEANSSTVSGKLVTTLFRGTGDTLKTSLDNYALPVGTYKIGVLVKKEGEDKKLKWADFQWLDIEVISNTDPKDCQITTPEGISIDKPGEVGKQYTFSLGTECKFPPKTLFFWDFGDGGTDEAVDNQVARHTFTKSGDFTVKLRVLMEGVAEYVHREINVKIGEVSTTNTSFVLDGKRYDVDLMYVTTERGIFRGVYKGGWMPFRNGVIIFVGVPYDATGPGSYECLELSQTVASPGYSVVQRQGEAEIYFSKSGSITVTRDDEWFEGTFNFVAKHGNSEKTVIVSDGKFKINKMGK